MLVALAPESAVQAALTGSVPILVPADEWEEVAEAIDDVFLGDASVWRRPMTGEADPFGVRLRVLRVAACGVVAPLLSARAHMTQGDLPYVSPEGYTIVDLIFGAPLQPLHHGVIRQLACLLASSCERC